MFTAMYCRWENLGFLRSRPPSVVSRTDVWLCVADLAHGKFLGAFGGLRWYLLLILTATKSPRSLKPLNLRSEDGHPIADY